jgi:hypothetical protein
MKSITKYKISQTSYLSMSLSSMLVRSGRRHVHISKVTMSILSATILITSERT